MGTLCEKGSPIDQAGIKLNPPAPSKFSDYNHTPCLALEMLFCRHLVCKTMSDLSPTFCPLRRAHMWSARAGPFSFQLNRTQPIIEPHLDISHQEEFLSIEKDEYGRLKKTYALEKKTHQLPPKAWVLSPGASSCTENLQHAWCQEAG